MNATEFREMAVSSSERGTRSGISDCRAGLSKARMAALRNEVSKISQYVTLPVHVNVARTMVMTIQMLFVMRISARRSTRSAITPPNGETSSMGSAMDTPSSPSASGLGLRAL